MINVIIPAYNCRTTLGRTLSSLAAQTDPNFEVIVVDDCSTEDIKSIVDDYCDKLSIVYIRNERNLGCGMSRQVGIDNATQKFITFLDSDDMFMPYTIETFNSIIEANPDIEYLHSYFYEQIVIDNNPAIYLWKDNYTACHGKLYNVELIKKYGIRNSPEIILGTDGLAKNMLLATYDMTKWYLSAYDMDSTFDLDWNGEILEYYDYDMPESPYNNRYSNLLSYIWDNYWDDYVKRYIELRKSVLSYSSIIEEFEKYIGVYGEDVYIQDTAIYTDIPSVTSNTLKSLQNFVRDRLECLDSEYGVVI